MTQRKFTMNWKSRNLILFSYFFNSRAQSCHIQWWWFVFFFFLIHLHKFLSNIIIIMYTLLLYDNLPAYHFHKPKKKNRKFYQLKFLSLHYLVAIAFLSKKKSTAAATSEPKLKTFNFLKFSHLQIHINRHIYLALFFLRLLGVSETVIL